MSVAAMACVRACVRAYVRCARARSRGLPRAARAWLRARAQVAGFDAGYAPRGRAERADDARALLLGGGREALISGSVRHFGNVYVVFCGPLILRCVASPYDGPTGNLSPRSRPLPVICVGGRRDGLGEASLRLLGGLPPCPARVEPSPAGERDALPSGHSSPRVLDTPEQRATMTS